MGSKGFLAGTRHLWRRGAGPADAFRNSRPLLALVTPGSRCQALALGDGGVDGDETPQVSTSHFGTAILILCRCPRAFSPAPSAALSWLQYHCATEARQMQTPSACRRPPNVSKKTVASVTAWQRPSCPVCGRVPCPAGRGVAGWQPGLSHGWITWEERSAGRIRKPDRHSRGGSRYQPHHHDGPRGFRLILIPGAGAD